MKQHRMVAIHLDLFVVFFSRLVSTGMTGYVDAELQESERLILFRLVRCSSESSSMSTCERAFLKVLCVPSTTVPYVSSSCSSRLVSIRDGWLRWCSLSCLGCTQSPVVSAGRICADMDGMHLFRPALRVSGHPLDVSRGPVHGRMDPPRRVEPSRSNRGVRRTTRVADPGSWYTTSFPSTGSTEDEVGSPQPPPHPS